MDATTLEKLDKIEARLGEIADALTALKDGHNRDSAALCGAIGGGQGTLAALANAVVSLGYQLQRSADAQALWALSMSPTPPEPRVIKTLLSRVQEAV